MVVKILFIICFFILLYFLLVELNTTRRWKRLVKYPQEYGMTDEEFRRIEERDRKIRRNNKLFEWTWYNPTSDIRRAKRAGFIGVPAHLQVGFADELWSHTSPYYRGRILSVEAFGVGWKDKYDTPRFESNPHIYITLFNIIGINIIWGFNYDYNAPAELRYDSDHYWEQVLWCLYYCDGDLNKARSSWPWRGMDEKSTWNEKYVKKK